MLTGAVSLSPPYPNPVPRENEEPRVLFQLWCRYRFSRRVLPKVW
jgi:hypothetical protein